VRRVGRVRQPASRCGPIVVGSERQSEPFVRHPKIAVATDSDRIGSYGSDLLRNHPDIGFFAPIVGEAVITETIVEPAQQHDIVLQLDVRATPTTAARVRVSVEVRWRTWPSRSWWDVRSAESHSMFIVQQANTGSHGPQAKQ